MRTLISKFNIRLVEIAILASSLLLMTACGSTSATGSSTAGSASTAASSATATPTPSNGNIYDLPNAPTYVATFNGAGAVTAPEVTKYVSPNIATSRTLRVKITPLAAPNLDLPGYTAWVFPYGCLEVNVAVNGQVMSTGVMQVAGVAQSTNSVCASAPTSQTLDFSNDISGNGTVNVTVNDASYDNCRYENPLAYGCAMSAIFSNHIVSMDVQIQSDGTYMQ